jgi:GNAT superfamily N-acetyltransferase
MEQWGPERIDALVDRLAAAMPVEDLTADEVFTACYDQPGVVFALDDGVVAAGFGRAVDGEVVASVRLLAASSEPAIESLLEAVEGWARNRGASRLEIGGALPFPLWPGVEAGSSVLDVVGRRNYVDHGSFVAHAVPTTFRAEPPVEVDVRRAVRDEDVVAVVIAAAANWPWWSDEIARALEHSTCHMATVISPEAGEQVVGIGCHSITRATWVGPLAVIGPHRRRGVGHALLGQVCRDLMIADFPQAEVHGSASVAFEQFLAAAGSAPVREYHRVVLALR